MSPAVCALYCFLKQWTRMCPYAQPAPGATANRPKSVMRNLNDGDPYDVLSLCTRGQDSRFRTSPDGTRPTPIRA